MRPRRNSFVECGKLGDSQLLGARILPELYIPQNPADSFGRGHRELIVGQRFTLLPEAAFHEFQEIIVIHNFEFCAFAREA